MALYINMAELCIKKAGLYIKIENGATHEIAKAKCRGCFSHERNMRIARQFFSEIFKGAALSA
jgi:hypothetical protein